MKICLCDVDEVILSWRESFSEWVYKYTVYEPEDSIHVHDKLNHWIKCKNEDMLQLITDFNKSEYFCDLKPYPLAQEYIPKIHDLGYKFIAITACASDIWTQTKRMENLYRYFPNIFIGQHCVGLGDSKFDYLKLYNPAIWVEDKISHAEDGLKVGHRCYLIDYETNRMPMNRAITRVKNWKEIYEDIEYNDNVNNWI